ncbi:MAG: hypothetical protein II965_05750 [Pyramidobacter sp.]|nr:hypothetical protein [Pyramidobacter sp.]
MADRITPVSVTTYDGAQYVEFAGLSTETPKETGNFTSGSVWIEVDTGDVYLYDRASSEWVKQFSLQS